MTAATTILEVFLCFTLLAVLSWQAAASTTTTSTTPKTTTPTTTIPTTTTPTSTTPKTTTTTTTTPTTPAMSPPTHDELTSSLFVNQLAILHLMHDSSNMSYAVAEMQRESDVDRALGERMDRFLAALEVQQKAHGERMDRLLAALEVQERHTQQVLDTNNSRVVEALLKVEELREEMQEELERLAVSQATEQPEEAAAVPKFSGEAVNSDNSLTSLCEGDKLLTGTVGALEVNSNGNYSINTMCSWNLKFPSLTSVSISWDYIEIENCSNCHCDWVEVLDVNRNSQHVYGKKMCGHPSCSDTRLLNKTWNGTNNLKVNFRSDSSVQSRGFRMLYRTH